MRPPLLRGLLPPNPGLTVTNNIVINIIINRITYDIPTSYRRTTLRLRSARTVFPPITVYGGWGKTVVCGERAGFACARATSTLLTASASASAQRVRCRSLRVRRARAFVFIRFPRSIETRCLVAPTSDFGLRSFGPTDRK